MSSDQPNVLLLMTDQQRYDSLGCYGSTAVHTPNLDRLAAEGVVFERCYADNPVCTPSRASMLTGKHLPGHGVYRLHDILPRDEVLITRRLQKQGYTTALFGKLHVSGRVYEAHNRHPQDGFDIYEWCLDPRIHMDSPFNAYMQWLERRDPAFCTRMRAEGHELTHVPQQCHMTHWTAERTIDFLRSRDGAKPFFCMMSIFDPHNPYDDYPLEMRSLIDVCKIPEPVVVPGEMDGKPLGMRREHERSVRGKYGLSLAEIREMRLGYYASIALADLEMGRVLDALEEKGIAEDTLVVFVSDHGDMLGDHQLFTKGAFFYDPCVRVPLIVRWPARLPAGRRVQALVQVHDLAATMLTAAGLPSETLQEVMPESRDLMPLAAGQEMMVRDHAVCCYRNSGYGDGSVYFDPPVHATMYRDERYKLSVFHNPEPLDVGCEGLLYDMEADKDEICDLWNDPSYQSIKIGLLQRLLDWEVCQELRLGSRGGEALTRPGR